VRNRPDREISKSSISSVAYMFSGKRYLIYLKSEKIIK